MFETKKQCIRILILYHVSVQNLKSFGPSKTELWVKEGGEFSVMLCGEFSKFGEVSNFLSWRIFCYAMWENELVGILLPTNMAAAI